MFIDEEDGTTRVTNCKCGAVRKSLQMIKASGLSSLLDSCTFATYKARDDWQKKAKESAMAFLNDHEGKWFYIGGQVGSGKTHICTAIVVDLLKKGIPAKYMKWRDEMSTLMAIRFDEQEYNRQMNRWKRTKVLYMDDLFKADKLNAFEKNATFEILNARYVDKSLITIISSEYTVGELMKIDEAIGSRIYERTRVYALDTGHDKQRNYRIYGGEA